MIHAARCAAATAGWRKQLIFKHACTCNTSNRTLAGCQAGQPSQPLSSLNRPMASNWRNGEGEMAEPDGDLQEDNDVDVWVTPLSIARAACAGTQPSSKGFWCCLPAGPPWQMPFTRCTQQMQAAACVTCPSPVLGHCVSQYREFWAVPRCLISAVCPPCEGVRARPWMGRPARGMSACARTLQQLHLQQLH
jgi:hypothetical protein